MYMKNAILLHGLPSKEEYYNPDRPSSSNSHWFPWLQKELMLKDIKADTPEVFQAFEMKWADWVTEVERFPINEDSFLVGHSMGGGFWVRYLSEHPEIKVAKVVLVAPWVNIDHEENTDFFEFTLNASITDQAKDFYIFASDDDGAEVQASVRYLIDKIPNARVKTFHEYGHFTQRTLKDNKFSELLETLLANS
jgi:predicted alpha/beta hydrolase family esterase